MDPNTNFFGPLKYFFKDCNEKKIITKNRSPHLVFSSLHGKGDTIRIGKEIQCLLYAGFFLLSFF